MSQKQEAKQPKKYVCMECGKEYTMKVNASNHARNTDHLDFEKVY